MAFSDYARTGFATYLLPIIPATATLSPHSKLTQEHLGKIPGLKHGKVWAGFPDWSKTKVREGVFPVWDKWYDEDDLVPTIGINARLFPAVDIDIDDPAYAAVVQDVAERVFGKTIVRGRSGTGKRLLMYRLEQAGDPIHKVRRVYADSDGAEIGAVEILGKGQQYLIEGMHPKGMKYEWADGKTPVQTDAECLPPISPVKVYEFIRALDDDMAFLGYKPVRGHASRGASDGTKLAIGPDHPQRAPSLDLLKQLLDLVPCSATEFADYDDWYVACCAIKVACEGNEEFYDDVYLPWQLENGKNSDTIIRAKWEEQTDGGAGWDWLCGIAHTYGFTADIEQMFEDLSAAPDADGEGASDQVKTGDVAPGGDSNDPNAKPQRDAEATIAEEFVSAHARKTWIYVPGTGPLAEWKQFRAGRWQDRPEGVTKACSRAGVVVATQIRTSASVTQAQLGRATYLSGLPAARNIQGLVRADERMVVTRPELDNRPLHMGVPGGYIGPDGLLHEPDPSLLLTKCAMVAPAPGPCPMWEELVWTMANKDPETFMALRSALGYTMTGSGELQKFFFLHGMSGHNGKTTFLQIFSRLLGSYAHLLPDGAFVASGRSETRFAFGGMEGAWLCYSNEIEQGEEWATARLKDKTGSGTTYIERKGVQGIEVPVHFGLWFQGNHLPVFRKVDPSLRARMVIFTLEHQFVEGVDEVISFADRCIKEEGPQIMRWLLSARQDYLKEGLLIPPSMIEERDEYINSQDAMRLFIEEDIDFVPGGVITSEELYEAWRNWRDLDGRNVVWSGSKETFCRSFVAHELCSKKVARGQKGKGRQRRRLFFGIKFHEHADEDAASAHL